MTVFVLSVPVCLLTGLRLDRRRLAPAALVVKWSCSTWPASRLSSHLNGLLAPVGSASRRFEFPVRGVFWIEAAMEVPIELSGHHEQLAPVARAPIWRFCRRSALPGRDERHPETSVPAPTLCDRSGRVRGLAGHLRRPSQDAGHSKRLLMQERASTMSNVT